MLRDRDAPPMQKRNSRRARCIVGRSAHWPDGQFRRFLTFCRQDAFPNRRIFFLWTAPCHACFRRLPL
ncbi:endonuclease/exonuclease/phosphatase domain protein [Burkholderia cepacia]|nr:endonuclease/exonuclease/phosphatase domain protein [Burkholderia cepacia]